MFVDKTLVPASTIPPLLLHLDYHPIALTYCTTSVDARVSVCLAVIEAAPRNVSAIGIKAWCCNSGYGPQLRNKSYTRLIL